MFVRCKRRFKDGKEHRYWSASRRGGRVVQRHEIASRWWRASRGPGRWRCFPRIAPALRCEVVKINVAEVSLPSHASGGRWPLWERLDLDRGSAPDAEPARHTVLEKIQPATG